MLQTSTGITTQNITTDGSGTALSELSRTTAITDDLDTNKDKGISWIENQFTCLEK